jgi:hypothetical protein
VSGRGGRLHPGRHPQTPDGTHVEVTAVEHTTDHQRVHSLTIATTHTYYVLAEDTPVLAHNCGGPVLLGRKADIEDYVAGKPGGGFDADFLHIRGTYGRGKKSVGGWNWTRNKGFIDDALESGESCGSSPTQAFRNV